MTTYDTTYSGNDTPADRVKALKDILDYLGEEKFNELVTELRALDEEPDLKMLRRWASLGGIQGYPVKALYVFLYNKEP